MERQLFFLILLVGGVWLLIDDFYGEHRISRLVKKITKGEG